MTYTEKQKEEITIRSYKKWSELARKINEEALGKFDNQGIFVAKLFEAGHKTFNTATYQWNKTLPFVYKGEEK